MPPPPVVDQFASVTATAVRLRELVQEFRPDILHAHSPVLDALAAFRVAKKHGLPVVYEVRSFWEDAALEQGTAVAKGPRHHTTRYLETRGLRRADAITAISEGLVGDIVAPGILSEKVTLIRNAVNTGAFSRPLRWSDALRLEFRRRSWRDGWRPEGRC